MVSDELCCARVAHVGDWRKPCTDAWHATQREWDLMALRFGMDRRAATLAGHACTIRFTASVAFFECTCGVHGSPRLSSYAARLDGEEHLQRIGAAVLNRIKRCGPVDLPGGVEWECNGDNAGEYCYGGLLENCDGIAIGPCDCPCNHDGGAL